MDLGSSTELITLKPWSTGKQLPLGFSVLGQTERKIMGFTFWIIMLILFHVALLFMVPWE
jgi:hypothetical protein